MSIWLGACSLSSEAAPPGTGGGTGGAPQIDPPAAACVASCDQPPSSLSTIYESTLPDGGWGCPADMVRYDSCDPRACVHILYCCDPVTGALTQSPCGDDGLRACPPGTKDAPNDACIPDDLNGFDCWLDGQPCLTPGEQCHAEHACTCVLGAEGAYLWSCTLS
jgi:hypothetical protein